MDENFQFFFVKYFKFSPQCSGSISGSPLFGVENFQVPPSNHPLSSLVIYERSLNFQHFPVNHALYKPS